MLNIVSFILSIFILELVRIAGSARIYSMSCLNIWGWHAESSFRLNSRLRHCWVITKIAVAWICVICSYILYLCIFKIRKGKQQFDNIKILTCFIYEGDLCSLRCFTIWSTQVIITLSKDHHTCTLRRSLYWFTCYSRAELDSSWASFVCFMLDGDVK